MAPSGSAPQAGVLPLPHVRTPPVPLFPVPTPPADDRVVDLHLRRAAAEAAIRSVAGAPVRHLPAAFLDALQGSWGTPQELLGARSAPVRLAVAR